MTLATVVFFAFAAVFLGGAVLAATTRRPSLASFGLILAVLAVSGLCVLLDAVLLAVWILLVACTAIACIYMYLFRGLGGTTPTLRSAFGAGHGLPIVAGATLLLQIVVAVSGLRTVSERLVTEEGSEQLAALEAASGGITAYAALLLLLAFLLVFLAFVAGKSLNALDPKEARQRRDGPLPRPLGPTYAKERSF